MSSFDGACNSSLGANDDQCTGINNGCSEDLLQDGSENPLQGGLDLSTKTGPSRNYTSYDTIEGSTCRKKRGTKISPQKGLEKSLRDIVSMGMKTGLPINIIHRAKHLFKEVHEGVRLGGRSYDSIASACLYLACRQEGTPRTLREISAVSKISVKEIGRSFKYILQGLETTVCIITPDDFVSRFCLKLGLQNDVQRLAIHITNKTKELYIAPGRSPISIAAAAIYMATQASDDKRSLKEIADITGCVSINLTYKLLSPHTSALIHDEFKFKIPIENID